MTVFRRNQNRTYARPTAAQLTCLFLLTMVAALGLEAQTLTVLHSFTFHSDGANPMAGLTMDAHGSLYGTASQGGLGVGTVYKLTPAGAGWLFTPLYIFQGGSNDGAEPVARVVFGPDNTLYGTTEHGGNSAGFCSRGCGTVFNLQPSASTCRSTSCPWRETVLYQFSTHDSSFGELPESEVTFDGAGNLYGTTYTGGYYDQPGGGGGGCVLCGVVYELSRSGGNWTEQVVYGFSGYQYGSDGALPVGGVTFDNAGNLYGTTSAYGDCGMGIVYQLTPGSEWSENILQQLCSNNGPSPTANLIYNPSSQTFYGDSEGDTMYGSYPGNVFTLTQSGGVWTFQPIYTFSWSGGGPAGQLVQDSAGNLYGTTIQGGSNPLGLCPNGCGTIFKLTPSNGGWTYSELYDFTGGSDGSAPHSNLIQDAQGNFYGTASAGGSTVCSGGCGVIFKFTP